MNVWIKLAIAAGAAVVFVVVGITLVTAIVRHGTYPQLQPFQKRRSVHIWIDRQVAMACPALTTL